MRPFAPAIVTVLLLVTAVVLLVREPARMSAATDPAQSLELLELSETVSGAAFTVTGRVRNPAAGPSRGPLSAVVLLFDNRGMTIGTGESEVAAHLEPGEVASFIVTLDATNPAAQYRVSFREGRALLPHVDRRPTTTAGASA